jgi:hypothetical protein
MSDRPTTADGWLEAVHREFESESDRAAAIVVGAMLDEALKSLLRKRLVAPVREDRSLLDGVNAPLDSFSARVDAAFQLGVISRYLARDLHLIRKIRNEFAHHPLECTFQTQRIKDWVRALEGASDYNRRNPGTRQALGPPGPRWDFLGIAAWILYSIYRDVELTVPISEHGPEFGYIDWDQLPENIRNVLPDFGAT